MLPESMGHPQEEDMGHPQDGILRLYMCQRCGWGEEGRTFIADCPQCGEVGKIWMAHAGRWEKPPFWDPRAGAREDHWEYHS
eukprot:g69539.t1